MKTVSIVLPCYNEEESLPRYFEAVQPVIESIEGYTFDFVLVDDGSKDKTYEVMEKIYQERNDVTIVKESRNYGQNAALTAGLMTAKGDYVVMMDVDLQDPVELLAEICKKFDEGYEVVNPHRASRKEDSYLKRTTAGMFYKFINKIEGKPTIPENVNCFRGLSRKAVDDLLALPEKDRYYVALVPLVGHKTATIDFSRQKREVGRSKYNLSKMFDYSFNLISTTTAKPLYFPIKFGAIASFITGVISLVFFIFFLMSATSYRFNYGVWMPLWIASFVLLLVNLLIFFLGILGVYLHSILINTRERPTTILEEVKRPEDKEVKE